MTTTQAPIKQAPAATPHFTISTVAFASAAQAPAATPHFAISPVAFASAAQAPAATPHFAISPVAFASAAQAPAATPHFTISTVAFASAAQAPAATPHFAISPVAFASAAQAPAATPHFAISPVAFASAAQAPAATPHFAISPVAIASAAQAPAATPHFAISTVVFASAAQAPAATPHFAISPSPSPPPPRPRLPPPISPSPLRLRLRRPGPAATPHFAISTVAFAAASPRLPPPISPSPLSPSPPLPRSRPPPRFRHLHRRLRLRRPGPGRPPHFAISPSPSPPLPGPGATPHFAISTAAIGSAAQATAAPHFAISTAALASAAQAPPATHFAISTAAFASAAQVPPATHFAISTAAIASAAQAPAATPHFAISTVIFASGAQTPLATHTHKFPSMPAPSPSLRPVATFSGMASFLGPAADCKVYVSLGGADRFCTDEFTGLPLPFAVSGILYRPPALKSDPFAVVSPVAKLLQYISKKDDNYVKAAYGFVGLDASNALTGSLAAIKSETASVRRTGVRMVFADAALSSLVITAVAALAAFPAGTLPSCTTEAALVNAVYGSLAARITTSASHAISLYDASLLSDVVTAAAKDECGASTATMSNKYVQALLTQGSLLYQMAQTELSADESLTTELTAMPLEALAVTSRVLYVVQTKAAAALADLDVNAQAVQEVLAGWVSSLASAPVNLASMAAVLGMPSAPSATNLKIAARATGGLAQCRVSVNDVYQLAITTATTDKEGGAAVQNVMGPMVTVPPGCHDAVLSTASRTVTNVFALSALTPLGVATSVVDAVAVLASAVFFAAAENFTSVKARHIDAEDYASVYHFFGVGKPSAKDRLPTGSDFVQQNWPVTAAVGARTYILNLKLQAVLGPLSKFVSAPAPAQHDCFNREKLTGLLGAGYSPDGVAQDLISQMARDLWSGSLLPANPGYTGGLMGSYYRRRTGGSSGTAAGRRRRLTALTTDQLSQLLTRVASALSDSVGMLSKLDEQIVAAAEAGTPFDPVSVFLSAAQIASVQQTSMTDALTQLSAAAASGDTDALTSLIGMALGVGAAVGAVGGVALIAVGVFVGLRVRKMRQKQHVSPRESRRFDAPQQQTTRDPEAGDGGGGSQGTNMPVGAASLPPPPSWAAATAAPPAPAAAVPTGPAPLPHTIAVMPEPGGAPPGPAAPVSWPPLGPEAAPPPPAGVIKAYVDEAGEFPGTGCRMLYNTEVDKAGTRGHQRHTADPMVQVKPARRICAAEMRGKYAA
ncbi:hypothetical protein VOLCADRAFT_89975 [Volvox carteri f. nagariensis]|uniref:Uncharacterized protein n=1 Tax=Volvox carteri f. nagariensis TaxID=3068 RepID=D8TT57_VOLCA|nr:uncharacterized protein VOLCADRAFT_89975 [Volvox carteri f. nagariensis]EFJ49137.1 hypothetical protein VOLCADRAFT_89975 [Volvox carteri f. nagariensis]|eukprot:XP_002949585.1 hypothetical protein VOLCADRAFT_89975 [Volvox carteri f. nagariensis]